MNALFEAFVCTVVGTELVASHGGEATAQDTRWTLDEGGRVRLRPDLVWNGRGRWPAAVLDTKYKTPGGGSVPESDLYQMHAYCVALGLDSGHLIYARARPQVVRVVRAGPQIWIHGFDLSGAPHELLESGRSLARAVAARAVSS